MQEHEVKTLKLAWQLCADIWRLQQGEHTLGYGVSPPDRQRVAIFNQLFAARFGTARIEATDRLRIWVADELIQVAHLSTK